jgi:hypothetical protein
MENAIATMDMFLSRRHKHVRHVNKTKSTMDGIVFARLDMPETHRENAPKRE